LVVVALIIIAIAANGASNNSTSSPSGSPAASGGTVVFMVSGNAPDGVSITYGSDTVNDSPSGTLGPLGSGTPAPWQASLPYNSSALYYYVSAQLQGSGSISCSVSGPGSEVNGQASGQYNICQAET
jgi:hypothetical protein